MDQLCFSFQSKLTPQEKEDEATVKRNALRAIARGKDAGNLTRDDIARMRHEQRGRCVYCMSRGKLSLDHKIPLSKGGTNDADNVQLLCISCNARKSDLLWEECKHRFRWLWEFKLNQDVAHHFPS